MIANISRLESLQNEAHIRMGIQKEVFNNLGSFLSEDAKKVFKAVSDQLLELLHYINSIKQKSQKKIVGSLTRYGRNSTKWDGWQAK